MKKIISAFAVICCISVFLTGCGETLGEGISAENICGEGMTVNDSANDAFNLYLENDALQLFINPDTVELKLVRKSDGFVWTSFVPGGDESQRSLIEITYLESSGSIGTMNSFNNAVIDGQYKIESGTDIVKIGFSMGGFSEQVLVPELLTPERYKEICDNLDDDFDLMKFQNYYYYFDCKDSNNEKENSYLQKYPALKEKSMYIVNDSVLTSSTVKKEFAAILQQSGYTSEMYYEDKENFDEKVSDQKEPGFNITLELSLKENSLVARIPNNSVEMYSEFPLITVSVLKYFGCSTENNGYFLLPDGSGSVMNFYNGKTDGHPYTVKVYGNGYSLSENEKTSDYANASLPVFGISKSGGGLFAEIFEGDCLAEIEAYSGDESKPAYAGVSFKIRETYISTLSSGKKESFTVLQKKRSESNFAIKYTCLDADKADYNSMASFYRENLFGSSLHNTGTPVVTEYIGMIEKSAQKFGIAYKKQVELSSFSDIQKNAQLLTSDGLEDLKIRLSGWFSGGYAHESTSKLKPLSLLGGQKAFNELQKSLTDCDTEFFVDADIQYTAQADKNDAVITINKSIGKKYQFDPASFMRVDPVMQRFVNTTDAIKKEWKGFEKYLKEQKITNVSLRSMGSDINADFNEKSPVDRQKTMEIYKQLLSTVSGNSAIMTEGCNAYTLPFLDTALKISLTSNRYDCTDYSVPFLQSVLRGYVNYTGEALNLQGDLNEGILRSAQTGAGIYCLLTSAHSNQLLDSDYSALYSTDFNFYKDILLTTVKKYQNDFKPARGQRIRSFKYIEDGLSETVFENNSRVLVNFNTYDVSVQGLQIKAKSYRVEG